MRETLPELDQVEDKLIKALQKKKVDCRFTGRMTYGGMRELVFQVEDVDAFRECVQGTIKNKAYRIELREEAGWRFFDEKVRPAPVFWQQISDRQVIEQLRAAGSNPSALHLLDHTFVGAPQKLARVKQTLEADGFQETYSSDDTLVMSKQSRLDLNEVFGVTGRLFLYSTDVGVQYDGWGAAVER
jgi:regulator of RNase E activity RraB